MLRKVSDRLYLWVVDVLITVFILGQEYIATLGGITVFLVIALVSSVFRLSNDIKIFQNLEKKSVVVDFVFSIVVLLGVWYVEFRGHEELFLGLVAFTMVIQAIVLEDMVRFFFVHVFFVSIIVEILYMENIFPCTVDGYYVRFTVFAIYNIVYLIYCISCKQKVEETSQE